MSVLFSVLFISPALSQDNSVPLSSDSTNAMLEKLAHRVDSLNLKIKDIIVTGNKVTKEYIITRELEFKKGDTFNSKKYINSVKNLNNLGIFAKAEIIPIPVSDNELSLNVDVQERPYIIPVPGGGVDEGEYFKKLYLTLNLKWDNFRGRNESLSLFGRVLYNPSIRFTYTNPWYAGKTHLFTGYTIGYSRTRNQSIRALGIPNGENTIPFEYPNFEWFNFSTDITFGKYFSRHFSVFTDAGYNYVRISQSPEGRTFNADGKDRYLNLGLGAAFDFRDVKDFTTKGYYVKGIYTRYGFTDKQINTGRFTLESMSFIPVYFNKDFYITLASRVYTSLGIGANIPLYQHVFLGYSDNYIRGWSGKAYEGEDELVVYNEIRIPVYQPRYINGSKVPIIKGIPVLNKMDLRHGLYLAVIYDVGATFDHTDRISKQRFLSGAGLGVDVILPFGLIGRADWVFRLAKPVVGEIGFSLSSKF